MVSLSNWRKTMSVKSLLTYVDCARAVLGSPPLRVPASVVS